MLDSKRKTAIYIRVSTKEQQTEGFGLEAQKSKLLSFVKHHPNQDLITKPEWGFSDVQSGSEYVRPGLEALKKKIKNREIDTLLVFKIDRLSRSLKHLLEFVEFLKNHDVALISMSENLDFRGPIGNLIFQIFGAFAQFERELIKNRTRSGIIASAEMGNFTGTRTPFGYSTIENPSKKGKKLVLLPKESAIVKEIFNWYIYEDLGDLAICKRLNQENRTRTGNKKWTSGATRSLLINTLYRGEYVALKKDENGKALPPDEWTIVNVPAAIDELTFQLAQAKRHHRNENRKPRSNTYLLSGKVIDVSTEGKRKFVGKPRTKGGRSYVRRSFKNEMGEYFPAFVIPAKPIEKQVWNDLLSALENPEEFIKEFLSKSDQVQSKKEKIEKDVDEIRADQINLEFQMARIEKAYEENIYTLEKMNSKIELVQSLIEENTEKERILQEELISLHRHQQTICGIRDASKKFNRSLEGLTSPQKQLLLQIFLEKVEVDRHVIGTSHSNRPKYQKTFKVTFRFDPKFYLANLEGGTTSKPSEEEASRGSRSKNKVYGGHASSRYYQVKIFYSIRYGGIAGKNGHRCRGAKICRRLGSF